MAVSLQDQLLKAGLADSKKAKTVAKEKRQQARAAKSGQQPLADDVKESSRKQLAEKVARDRALNAAKNESAQRKAINAQIKQLIEGHRDSREGGTVDFHFSDGKKIKKILVHERQRARLVSGLLKIVTQGDRYELVPAPVADKIAPWDPERVIDCRGSNEPELTEEEKDWYKDFEIPDDVDW